jgi:hypothetical protein
MLKSTKATAGYWLLVPSLQYSPFLSHDVNTNGDGRCSHIAFDHRSKISEHQLYDRRSGLNVTTENIAEEILLQMVPRGRN